MGCKRGSYEMRSGTRELALRAILTLFTAPTARCQALIFGAPRAGLSRGRPVRDKYNESNKDGANLPSQNTSGGRAGAPAVVI